ncbi:MAG: hypothetical protein K0S61_3574 [Anaerocolumna sp.]|nr:hypothetical protein [Anaerocolumna sp.]
MNKPYSLLVYLIFAIVILSGCGAKDDKDVINHNYIYSGENEFWTGEYEMDATEIFEKRDGVLTYENKSSGLLTVTYKGAFSELTEVKQVDISYKSSKNSGRLVNDYSKESPVSSNEFKIRTGGENSALSDENDVIYVEINIDGVTESLELKTDPGL